jgi:isopentenyldiphosphate isomerase
MVLVHEWGVDAILASRSSIRLRLSDQSELDRVEWCKTQNKRKSVFAQDFLGPT